MEPQEPVVIPSHSEEIMAAVAHLSSPAAQRIAANDNVLLYLPSSNTRLLTLKPNSYDLSALRSAASFTNISMYWCIQYCIFRQVWIFPGQ